MIYIAHISHASDGALRILITMRSDVCSTESLQATAIGHAIVISPSPHPTHEQCMALRVVTLRQDFVTS